MVILLEIFGAVTQGLFTNYYSNNQVASHLFATEP